MPEQQAKTRTTQTILEQLKQKAKKLKSEVYALYFAYRDPRVPWYAKAFIAFIVAYAFSPIDLIPDFIPVLGYLDDMIIIPLSVSFALKMIPEQVMEDAHIQAKALSQKPKNWIGAAIIVTIWLIVAAWIISLFIK